MYKRGTLSIFSRAVALTVLAALVFLFAVSCGCSEVLESEPLTKNEIYENISEDRAVRESVARHLYEWGLPTFNVNKFNYVESLLKKNYYQAMPDKLTHATLLARGFLDHFYDGINIKDVTAVTDALLTCYMAYLGDPYAAYRIPSEHEIFMDDISGGGTFVGVGVQVRMTEEGYPYVVSVYRNSGAELAGILPHDVLLSVDGVSALEAGYDATVDALKGEVGTSVSVVVLREGKELEINIERKVLPASSVSYYFDENTGYAYLNITTFRRPEDGKHNGTADEFKAAIDELEKKGLRGIVFDLRSNLGGELNAVKDTVSYLVEDALPLLSYSRRGELLKDEKTAIDGHVLSVPTVVLVNEFTASAAEIFTAALRDYRDCPELGASNKNIVIVGKNTYGKGVSQSSYMLSDGSSVTFTAAYYNPPSGVNYHGVGVAPDEGYEVEARFSIEGDAQLDKAYEALDGFFAEAAA